MEVIGVYDVGVVVGVWEFGGEEGVGVFLFYVVFVCM